MKILRQDSLPDAQMFCHQRKGMRYGKFSQGDSQSLSEVLSEPEEA